jgi:hypothetical protein
VINLQSSFRPYLYLSLGSALDALAWHLIIISGNS